MSKFKTVRCASGLKGWQGKLQNVYSSYDEFVIYCETYDIHSRLGYNLPIDAWNANPTIQGSVNSSDLKVVKP